MASILENRQIIYGTHRMTDGIVHGLNYGIIDTATGYNNAGLINQATSQSGIHPIVITKFNTNDFTTGIDHVVSKHVDELGCQPNIVLLHGPFKTNQENLVAVNKLKNIFPSALIGVSNFDLLQTRYLIDSGFVPDVVQIEYHPLFQPKKLLTYCQEKGIKIMAYRPFGKGDILKNKTIKDLSDQYGIKPNHLILKWLWHKYIIPVVSSNNPDHIVSNMEYHNISINMDIINTIDNMDLGLDGSTCMVRFSKTGDTMPIF
jgi:diketogulonate reductase-like aldo/keto reductase